MKRNSILGYIVAAAVSLSILCAEAGPVHPLLKGESHAGFCALKEQRDEKYANLLRVSVKVSSSNGSGSGTVCYYDEETGWAYVISCGHLWEGNRQYDPSSSVRAKITVWYQAGPRLSEPRSYEAEALFWSNRRGKDASLLKFKPDWTPEYAPIAHRFDPAPGTVLNSMGCDGGKEVARYGVKVKGYEPPDILTSENSPRPGRSGGGLLRDEMELVGVCWGTSEPSSGNGEGYFTPLESIKEVFRSNGHGWLLDLAWDARMIPVVDHDDPHAEHGRDFVPTPKRRSE